MATLHFICGKAGSGKTTLAREKPPGIYWGDVGVEMFSRRHRAFPEAGEGFRTRLHDGARA